MSLRPTLALLALVSLPLMAAQNDPQPSSKELMKEHQAQIQNDLADVDYKRKRIVEANMNLTDQEGEKFWPIYNTYRTESDKLSKETLKLLLDYAQAYNSGNVSDDQVRIPRHSDTQPTLIRTPVPRSFGQAVGAQRRRGGIVSPGWLASSISASVCALIHPSD